VALYSRDADKIDEMLDHAQHALVTGKLTPEQAACLDYQLAYLELQAQMVRKKAGWVENRLPDILYSLAAPCQYAAAERLRGRLYLQVRILLDRTGKISLHESEFDKIFAQIPDQEHTTEMWHYISAWAFKYESVRYLELTYEFAVQQPGGFNVAWNWQRIEIMIKLARGVATPADLEWLIDKVQLMQHFTSISKDIWPKAMSLGLVTEKVQLTYEAKRMELEEHQTESLGRLINSYCSADQRNSQAGN
jgi:hypothetical protein